MDSLDIWTFWTLHLETELKNIQRENRKCNWLGNAWATNGQMKFYGLSGLSGRLDTLDTAFRGRIKKNSMNSLDSLDSLDVWTLLLETEIKNIQGENRKCNWLGNAWAINGQMKFYGLSGLSGRLDTPFRDRIKKYSRGKSILWILWTLWTSGLSGHSI